MTRRLSILIAALVLVELAPALAQYAPPPPLAPYQGYLNEWLRKEDPRMKAWDLGGALRLRYEVKDQIGIAGVAGSLDFRDHGADVDNEYLLTRLRLHAGYADKWWGAYVEGRSSLAASDERFAYANSPAVPGTIRKQGDGPESDTIDLHQAYVTIGNAKEFPLSLKAGRQELLYGDERLVGAYNWNNIGRVFDAAKLRWQNDLLWVDVFSGRVVIPEDGRFNVDNAYDWLSGVYAGIATIPKNSLELYFLARNASPQAIAAEPSPQFPQPSARDIYTLGGRLKSKPGELGHWDYLLEGAYQFGDFRDLRRGVNSPRLDHEAFMVVAQAGYTFTQAGARPRLALEYDFGSGDSNPQDGKHGTFENLFPTNHKFYGAMDFVSLENIHDARAIFQLRPHRRLSLVLEGHGFWLADTHDNFYTVGGAPRGGLTATPGTGYGINPGYGSFVGTEVDVIAGYALARSVLLEAGYGHFFVGDYVTSSLSASTVGSADANYVYVQGTLSF